ncbi:MAG: PDZ domain-containing protein [Firmicutes bacterium]|nr:PDZ domain-containing protein [Bacillota bacterium]
MKKVLIFLCLLAFPLNVLAYSNEVILGGNTIGIDIKSTGVMIIGFYKVNGKYPTTDLIEGDLIIKVGDNAINDINDLTSAIEKNIINNKVNITYLRGNKEKQTTLELSNIDGIYKTGLYVKDSITGIGTLTFIDPETNTYGALGHEILESNTSKMIEVNKGTIFRNSISNIDISTDGNPGSKNAKFYYRDIYGDVLKNTKYGIYGIYENLYDESKLIEIGNKDDVGIGKAKIYTVIEDEKVEEFEIYITKINENSDIKNITFEITDKKLLEATGGIVQGMSGSPIVQNGKLIGAVTHVITDNVKTGYGLFITTMLEESEK